MNAVPLHLPTLFGEHVRLREWRQSDTAIVRDASHDPLIPLLTTVPDTAGEPEALAFIERQNQRVESGAGYVFAIANEDDRAVGHIGLFFTNGAGARASIGYWVGPSERRRGYAADALATLTSWSLRLHDLDRLELYVEPWNVGSWRAAEKAGYEREGLLRAWERIDGRPRDMYMYARITDRARTEQTEQQGWALPGSNR
ncbi:GNAT family protein [Agreia sp. VKM Ac-1783]|uniref:GNAT family N-acetyltransferase n=1 Tax=Agreia sp. VKM Ac-1783 TaxID=1938889 RepID=UPI000A3A6A9B|nr:GNAT family protein [Agreia sp. VKM Ac-1783]